MEDTLLYPRELIAERVRFTPADHPQIALCRGDHHRLGLAYQMAFCGSPAAFRATTAGTAPGCASVVPAHSRSPPR